MSGRGAGRRAFSRFVRPPSHLAFALVLAASAPGCGHKGAAKGGDGGAPEASAPAPLGSFAHAPSGPGPLYPVLEGQCPGLLLSPLDGATFVTYGAEMLRGDDAGLGYVPELAAGWPLATSSLHVGRLAGVFLGAGPRSLEVRVDGVRGLRRGRFDGASDGWHWDETYDLERGDRDGGSAFLPQQSWETRPWLKGSRLRLAGCRDMQCQEEPRVKLVTLGDGAPPPPNLAPSDAVEDEVMAFDSLPTGDVFAVLRHCGDGDSRPVYDNIDGQDGHCLRVSHWSPTTAKLETWTVPMGPSGAPEGPTASVLARSPTEVYVGTRRRAYREAGVAIYDGKAWRRGDAGGVMAPGLYDAGTEGVWARSMSGVLRVGGPPGSATETLPPEIHSVQGASSRRGAAPWAFGKSSLFRRDAGSWTPVTLPPLPGYAPPAVMSVAVAADDTWVHLQYPALAETASTPPSDDPMVVPAPERRAAPFDVVMRTRRPSEVKRCSTSPPQESLAEWPPAAGPTCATPVALLFPVEPSELGRSKAAGDAAVLRARRPGLAPFVTVRFGDHVFVGMRVKEVEPELAATLWSAVPGARLELVCLSTASDQPFVVPAAPSPPASASASALPPPPPPRPDFAPKARKAP